MKKRPRMYAERTLTRMYAKLPFDEQQVATLHQYFTTFSDTYQVISMQEAFDIIRGQWETELSEADFIAFAEIARHEVHPYAILSMDELYKDAAESTPMEWELIQNALLEDGLAAYEQAKADRQKAKQEEAAIEAATARLDEIIAAPKKQEPVISDDVVDLDEFRNMLLQMNVPDDDLRVRLIAEVMKMDPRVPTKAIAKNAPCPCGSGKKYKRCCGKNK